MRAKGMNKAERSKQYVRCGKCKHFMPESCAIPHLEKCQPNGAICGKCKAVVKPADFMTHIKGCKGVQVENQEQKEAIGEPAKSV